MSATIDEKLIKFKFDNEDFEKNVSTSLSTLDKLKNALLFTKQREELSTLSEAIDMKGFDAMGKSIDTISNKFSALGIAGMEFVRKMTDQAIDAGERMVKSLSIDQIASGWDKYAKITSSVQTILAATKEQGETMESVTEQIEKLSWFTDETSYSLNDMTDNIAKFTSNGIELKAATTQMQGIAAAAALAGANTQEASHAMSGFSKAMGEGSMKRQHWQWIQTAHVDTMQFKQTLIDTAVELGTLKKVGEGIYETLEGNEVTVSNFETAMKDAWITTDVMSNTLELYGAFSDQLYEASKMTGLTASELLDALDKYQNGGLDINKLAKETGKSAEDLSMIMTVLDQEALKLGDKAFRAAQEAKTFEEAIGSVKDAVSSGWMKTFELIFGNYEEAKVLWTDFANAMYDVFAESGNARNAILELWRAMEGREALIKGVSNAFNGIVNFVDAAKGGLISSFFGDATDEEIMKMIADRLSEITNKFKDFTENMLLSDENLEKVGDVFKKFGDTLQNVYNYFKEFVISISPLTKIFSTLFDSAKRIASAFGMLFDRLRNSRRDSDETVDIFEKIYKVVDNLSDHISSAIGLMTTFVDMFIVNDMYFFIESIRDLVDEFKKFNEETGFLNEMVETLKSTLSGSFDIFLALTRSVIKIYKAFGRLFDKLKGNKKETENTYERFGTLHDKIDDVAESISNAIDKVSDFFEKLIDTKLYNFIETIKNGVEKIKKFNEETGILTKTMQILGTVVGAPFYIIYKMVTTVVSLIKEFLALPAVQKIVTDVFDSITNFGKNAYDKIVEIVDYFKKIDPKKFIGDISEAFSDAKENAVEFFKSLEDKFTIITVIKEEFQKAIDNFKLLTGGVSAHTLYDELEDPLEDTEKSAFNLKETLSLLIDKLKNFFTTLDANKLIALTFSLTMLGMFINVAKLVKSFTDLTEQSKGVVGSVKDLFTSIGKPFNSLSKTIESFAKKEKIKVLEIAEALGIVALSIAGLALMDSKYHDNLINAGIMLVAMGAALTIFVGVLTAISKAAKKADSWKELLAIDAAMVSLSIGVLVLSAAVKVLEGIDFLEAEKNVLIIAELAAILGGVTVLVTRFAGKGFKGFFTLVGMALVMNQFAKAMKEFGSIKLDGSQENIKALIVIFAGLSLLALAASRIGVFSVVGMLILVLSINKIIPAIKDLISEMHFADGLDRVLKVLSDNQQIVMAIGILASAMIMVSSIFGDGIKKFGTGMILFSLAFLVVGRAIRIIGEIGIEKINKAMDVVLAVFGLFTVMSLVLGITNGGKNALRISGAIMLMSMSLYPIAGAVWLLGTMDAKKVEQGTNAVSALMICFALITAAAGLAQGSKTSFGTVMGIVAGIVLLAAEMIVLTLIPVENVRTAALALCGIIFSLATALYSISKRTEKSKSAVGELVMIAIILGEVAYALYKLSDFNWRNIIGAAGAMTIVMLGIAMMLDVLDVTKISTWKRSWQIFGEVLLLLIPAVAALAVLSYVTQGVNWQNLIASAISLDIVMVGLAYALSNLDVTKISTWKRSGEILGEAFGVLIPAVAALAVLSYVTQGVSWQNLISSAVSLDIVFTGIMFALSKFPVDKVLGVIDSAKLFVELLAILAPVVAALWFLSNYGGSWDKMIASAISISITIGVLSLVCAVLSKVGLEIVPAIKAAVAVGLFIDILIALIGLMALGIGYIPDEVYGKVVIGLDRMIQVMGKIGEMVGVFIGGIAGGTVEKVMESVGKGLELFSQHASVFTDWVETIDNKVSEGAKNLAVALLYLTAGELMQSLIGFVTGPLGKYALKQSFQTLGEGVKAFAEAVADVDANKVKNAADAAQAILGIDAPNSGGLISLITGENFLGFFNPLTLGGAGFGGGLRSFATAVSGLSLENVQGGINIAQALFELDPPNTGGLISLLTGENFLGFFNPLTLGGPGFGGGLRSFATAVSGISFEDTMDGLLIAEGLFDLKAPNSGGMISWFTGDNKLWDFNWLTLGPTGFGGGIRSFANAVSDINYDSAEAGLLIAEKIFELDPPNSGGLISWFVGDNQLWKFNWLTLGSGGFGGGIKAFANCIKGISWTDVAGGIAVSRAICALEPKANGGLLGALIGGTLKGLNASYLGEDGLGGGIKAFCDQVSQISDDAISKSEVAAGVLEVLDDISPPRTGGIIGWADKFLTGGAEENFSAMATLFGMLGDAVYNFSSKATQIDGTQAKTAVQNLSDVLDLLKNTEKFDETKITGFANAMNQAGDLGIKAFCDSFYKAQEKIDAAIGSFASKVNTAIQNNQTSINTSMSTLAQNPIDSYTATINANQPYVNATMEELAQGSMASLTGENGFAFDTSGYSSIIGDMGINFDNSLVTGLIDSKALQGVHDSGSDVANEVLNGLMSKDAFDMSSLTSPSETMNAMGIKIPEGLGSGMLDPSALGGVTQNAQEVVKAISNELDTSNSNSLLFWDKLVEKGRNVIRGFAAGLGDTNLIDQSAGNVGSLASRVNAEWDNYWKIHSPSKVAEEHATYVMEGYALGFRDHYGTVMDAASSLGEEAYNALAGSTQNINNYVSENLDLNPSVTPFLDITGLQRDANNINSLFEDSNGLTINSHLGAMTDMFGEMNANSLLSNNQIVTSLQSLHEDVQNLQNVVGNLQVIMDSGTLVGAIAPNMDVALGQMAMYKRRGM